MSYYSYLKQAEVNEDEAVEQTNGRWYIAMGLSGFNSPANNAFGYDTKAKALAAIRRYQAR